MAQYDNRSTQQDHLSRITDGGPPATVVADAHRRYSHLNKDRVEIAASMQMGKVMKLKDLNDVLGASSVAHLQHAINSPEAGSAAMVQSIRRNLATDSAPQAALPSASAPMAKRPRPS